MYRPIGISLEEVKIKNNKSHTIKINNECDIKKMKNVCAIGRMVLNETAKIIKVGITTDKIDKYIHELCIKNECYPSLLDYFTFPKSCCTSVNKVICHGILEIYFMAQIF